MQDLRIKTNDVTLQVREYPHPGETLIFLHFGGGNLRMWDGVIPYFEGKFHLVLVDLKGHGKSDKPTSGYRLDQLANEVAGVMDHLKIANAHLIGSSLGAEVGLSLAANHPERVRSLVLDGALFSEYGPFGLWEDSEESFQEYAQTTLEKMRAAKPTTYPSVEAYVEASRKSFEELGWWSDIFAEVQRYDAIPREDGTYTGSWGRIAADYTQYYLFNRIEDDYRRVQCPVLMLPDTYPGQSEREKEIMQGLFEIVGQGKIVAVPEWVHPFGWMLTPESVSQAVLDFLDEI